MDRTERFVPLRVDEVTRELAARSEPDDAGRIRSLGRLVSALYHFEFHDREQAVLAAWQDLGDDTNAAEVAEELTRLLEAANYVQVTMEEVREAMANESVVPLRLEVDLDDYEELLIYRRGTRRETIDVERWKGLRTEQRTITVEDRVVVYARVRSASWFAEHDIDPSERNLEPGAVTLKQFKSVPRADITTLLPSTRVRLRPVDSVVVGVPALASGIVVLATKLLPTLGLIFVLAGAWLGLRSDEPDLDQGALVALFGGVVALGAFMFRQWTRLKNRRLQYLKTLSETLFFRMLGDGPGVLHTLLASAEEQEVIEVLVGYQFLLDTPDGLSTSELDEAVEQWLRKTCDDDIDFEVDDAVAKLHQLELITGEGRLQAVALDDALARLDRRWDQLFDFDDQRDLVPLTKA